MTTVQLPEDYERKLRTEWPEMERHVLEALVAEGFRAGKLSSYEVGQTLGLENRWETIDFLSNRDVYPGSDTGDIEEGRRTFEKLAGKSQG